MIGKPCTVKPCDYLPSLVSVRADTPPPPPHPQDTVNRRAVRILLECKLDKNGTYLILIKRNVREHNFFLTRI